MVSESKLPRFFFFLRYIEEFEYIGCLRYIEAFEVYFSHIEVFEVY